MSNLVTTDIMQLSECGGCGEGAAAGQRALWQGKKNYHAKSSSAATLRDVCAVLMYSIAGDMKKRTNDTVSVYIYIYIYISVAFLWCAVLMRTGGHDECVEVKINKAWTHARMDLQVLNFGSLGNFFYRLGTVSHCWNWSMYRQNKNELVDLLLKVRMWDVTGSEFQVPKSASKVYGCNSVQQPGSGPIS